MLAMMKVVGRGRSVEGAASTIPARVIDLEADSGPITQLPQDVMLIEDATQVGGSSTLAVDHPVQPASSNPLQSVAIPVPVQKRARSPVSNANAATMPSLEQASNMKRPQLEQSAGPEHQAIASNVSVCS
jgi:hypothetical protein